MVNFGAVSYGVLGAAYAVLVALLLTTWRGKRLGGFLIIACFASAAWAAVLAFETTSPALPAHTVFTAEVLRSGAWLTFLVALLAQIGVSRLLRFLANAAWIGVLAAGALWWIGQDLIGPTVAVTVIAIPGGLVISLIGLVLIEQLYRNTPSDARGGLKALALSLGGMFAYDLFLYSQGMLFGVLDVTAWHARGAVNLLFVPLIAVAARRSPEWELRIFVSRQVVFYTTSLFVVGAYLLLMSFGGYLILIYGGSWGEIAQVVFFVGAILVLVVLMMSNTMRARMKVFLSKHFFRNKYDYREEWLRLISTLASFEDSSTRQIVVKAIGQIVNSPGGALWILNDDSEFDFAAAYEIDEVIPNIPVDLPLIRFINKEGWLVDLDEYKRDPSLYDHCDLPQWLNSNRNAWLIVPLLFRQKLFGLVLLYGAPGRPKLNFEDRDLLKTVGNHLAIHLVQEKSDNLLAEARQFEAYNRLTAFLMHDLNNLIAQQSLIIKNAEKHKRNPEFVDDAVHTIANSVDRMKKVMDQLKRGEAESKIRVAEVRFLISAAVDRCRGKLPTPELKLNGIKAAVNVDTDQFTMVLIHLIQNAQEATPDDGDVVVSALLSGDRVTIKIADNGCGMTADFVRDHLFKPFDTTKGSQGMGIGAYQAREFARKMGGSLDVESAVARGTTITISLPVTETATISGQSG